MPNSAMHVVPASVDKIKSFPRIDDYPLAAGYLRDPLYSSPDYEWYFIFSSKDNVVPAGIMCLYDSKFIGNYLHLSVLEIASPLHGYGYGSEFMCLLKELAKEYGYSGLTLMLRTPELEHFYSKFGFEMQSMNGISFMKWDRFPKAAAA